MSKTATGFWVTHPGVGELKQESLAVPSDDDVQVRALYSGVSRGTESLVFNARVPESEYGRMRAPFQRGEFPWPVKYGYCSVGRVERGPERLLGKRVLCLYPHQDRYVVPAETVLTLPEGLPADRAVLAANMETAINGVWDANPMLGERVLVVGAGVVGALVAYLCRQIPGVDVHLVDLNPQRATLAEALDLSFSTPDQAPDDQECIIHASGHPEGLQLAFERIGREGRIIEMSWFGEGEVALPLGGSFHSQRLTLRASQVGQLPSKLQPRWNYRRRLALALELLADPRLEVLISGESSLADFVGIAPILFGPNSTALCHRIVYAPDALDTTE